ncbi:MAG: CHAT domain-containing protein [Pseudomonadales bacterium]|nr:CHAT domain-containing protein [Pseudomonadales bacterium]
MRLVRVTCLAIVIAFSSQGACGVSRIERILGPKTATEDALTRIAAKIVELPGDGARSDKLAERLYLQGRKRWEKSPANSKTTITAGNNASYEVHILVDAMVDYYRKSGRPGEALPYLEAAAAESRSLRYYDQWRKTSLELVRLYRSLGMLDHAETTLTGLLKFMSRIGLSLEQMPARLDVDTVIFLQLHAQRLEMQPDAYDEAVVDALYSLFRRSAEQTPALWGWSSLSGFRYVEVAPAFLAWFAASGNTSKLQEAIRFYRRLNETNLATDPLLLADELDIDFITSPLGRDLFQEFAIRTSRLLTWKSGVFDSAGPEKLRFIDRDPFIEALTLARIAEVSGDLSLAQSELETAKTRLASLDARYARIAPEYRVLDLFELDRMRLTEVRAATLEKLGRSREALNLYRQHIDWSERERESLPLDERLHFFRGRAREAYLGAIRTTAAIYASVPSTDAFIELLDSCERLKARQMEEVLGVSQGAERLSIESIRAQLREGDALLLVQDAGRELVVALVSHDRAVARVVSKRDGWDDHIVSLRDRLARDASYDRAAFGELGKRLFGFVAADIAAASHLYVMVDGALSMLPPSILPYDGEHLLDDGRFLTQLPSINIWLADSKVDEVLTPVREQRAFVVADPAFETARRVDAIGRNLMATRGSNALRYFARLPETLDEGRAVLQTFSSGSMLSGVDASESKVKSMALDGFSFIHFATHGVIGSELPDIREPALVLSWEEGEDGFLYASEVARLRLNAKLTVLSACNTGNGRYYNGEGLMGMGRAFLIAGSQSVIVSLWPVESFATKQLMVFLYQNMANGFEPSKALWLAQRQLRGDAGARGSATERGLEIVDETLGPAGTGVRPNTHLESAVNESASQATWSNPFYWSPFIIVSTR